jgi:hypothetical protein
MSLLSSFIKHHPKVTAKFLSIYPAIDRVTAPLDKAICGMSSGAVVLSFAGLTGGLIALFLILSP